jgi:hypothetical protein
MAPIFFGTSLGFGILFGGMRAGCCLVKPKAKWPALSKNSQSDPVLFLCFYVFFV